MTKALTGVRILDFTHVQSGPTCTQLLAWFGADVIKVERPGIGDITRGQLQDVPNVDSLYFTMLNHNKRSITLDTKNPKGKEVLTELIRKCDALVENFGPGVLDRMGFSWEKIHSINPKMIVASIKGFGPGPYEDCKVYENVAQCTGGAASTTGSATACRSSRARRLATAVRDFILRSASSPRCFSAPGPARASASRPRCRMACSTCAGSSCATSSGSSTDR
jgi:crotonobetainyl-CoA:carnitine CoA-transferase CaiB-like acyl-CoA transferase